MYLCSDMSGRYINPYTDFGFKYLFGTENKAGLSQEPSHVTIQFTILILKTFAWLEEFAYLCNWIIFQALEYLSQGLVYIFQVLKHRPLNIGVNNSTKHKKKR